jgi:cellulose synthase/poly-beta-1,6-N-acetylglucosamine synthase-like glycosyltransferase
MFLNHLADKFVPLLTWILITFPLWMSPFHPALVAYFIIAFDIYFLYKALRTAYFASLSYQEIQLAKKNNYVDKLASFPETKKIRHFVIIPNYKEPLYKLELTIGNLVKNDYPGKKIYLVLAFEKRENEAVQKQNPLLKNSKTISTILSFPITFLG